MGVMLLGKGLVGYVDAANGHRLIFAAYVNLVPLHNMDDVAGVGETLCQIAALAYQYAPPRRLPRGRLQTARHATTTNKSCPGSRPGQFHRAS